METINFEIRGVAPLLCCSAQLADPFNEWAIAIALITGKSKKTDADRNNIARLEWRGSLYLNKKGEPIIPTDNIERMVRDGAAQSRSGKKVQAGFQVQDDPIILCDGPKDLDKMWASGGFHLSASVKIGKNRVMRTRACFPAWALKFTANFDESLLNEDRVRSYLNLAGREIGLGDWRPRYGRFEVVNGK